MNKKDYTAIAEIIDGNKQTSDDESWDFAHLNKDLVFELADYFQKENPRFDRERFLKACGVKEND